MKTRELLQLFLLLLVLFVSTTSGNKGCVFNNEIYAAGETIFMIPEACLVGICIYFDRGNIFGPPGGPPEGYYIKLIRLSKECGKCCVYEGKLYGPGDWVNMNHDDCIRSTCKNGAWVDKDETDTCCIYVDGFEEKYYLDGEVIEVDNCTKIWCNATNIVQENYTCCCEDDHELYECDEFLPDPWGCIFEKCVNGTIRYVIEQGCCDHFGFTYWNGDIIGNGDDPCNYLQCIDGDVKLVHNEDCCRHDCGWVAPGTVVEENAYKCILKKCEKSQIKDYSLADECNCCIYNGTLYRSGTEIPSLSPCIRVICVNGTWQEKNSFECIPCIIRDDPHFRTFRGQWYTFHSHCCNTLMQKKEFGYSTINHVWGCFGNCPAPFFLPGPSCILEIRFQHDADKEVIIKVSGEVLVNGKSVNLPYYCPNGLIIFRTLLTITAVTFDGVLIEVHTTFPLRVARLWAPPEMAGQFFGLCGVCNDNCSEDVFRLRNTPNQTDDIYEFGNSWKFPEDTDCPDSVYIDTCDGVPPARLKLIKDKCSMVLNQTDECEYVGDSAEAHFENCVSDMCACGEAILDQCIDATRNLYHEECQALNMTIPPVNTTETPPDCPTPPPCTCEPTEVTTSVYETTTSSSFHTHAISTTGSSVLYYGGNPYQYPNTGSKSSSSPY